MADVIGEGVIEITADTSGFGSSMGPLVKTADTTAKSVSKSFAGEFGKVSGAAGALSAEVGGAFGKIGSLANSAIKPIAEVALGFGAAGTAIAGIAAGVVAIGAVAAAAKGLADGAVDARDRLEEMGIEVTGEAARDLDSYAAATRDLGIALDEVRVAVGSDIAGELAVLARVVATNTGAILDWAFAISDAADTATDWISFGIKPAWEMIGGALYDSLTKTTRATSEAAGTMAAYTTELAAASAAAAELNNEMERTAQADEIAGRAEARRQETEAIRLAGIAEREEMAETERQRSEVMAVLVADISSEEAMSAATRDAMLLDNEAKLASRSEYHDAYLSMLLAEGESLQAAQDEEEAHAEVMRDLWTGLVELSDEVIGAITKTITQAHAVRAASAQATSDAERDALAQFVADSAEYTAYLLELGATRTAAEQDEIDATIAGYEDRIDAADKTAEDQRQKARASYEIGQSMAEIAAFVQAAVLGIEVAVAVAPYMGPLAWSAPAVGAAAASVAFGSAMAGIEAAPTPEFPMGRPPVPSPDHSVVARLQPEEAVLNGRGVDFAGGPEAVEEWNRGVRRSDREDRLQVDVSIDPRLQRLQIRVDRKMGKRPRRGR